LCFCRRSSARGTGRRPGRTHGPCTENFDWVSGPGTIMSNLAKNRRLSRSIYVTAGCELAKF
jgi:hypothetical protein